MKRSADAAVAAEVAAVGEGDSKGRSTTPHHRYLYLRLHLFP
jgi:hypothetical protein